MSIIILFLTLDKNRLYFVLYNLRGNFVVLSSRQKIAIDCSSKHTIIEFVEYKIRDVISLYIFSTLSIIDYIHNTNTIINKQKKWRRKEACIAAELDIRVKEKQIISYHHFKLMNLYMKLFI
jgi:hypothetical protein